MNGYENCAVRQLAVSPALLYRNHVWLGPAVFKYSEHTKLTTEYNQPDSHLLGYVPHTNVSGIAVNAHYVWELILHSAIQKFVRTSEPLKLFLDQKTCGYMHVSINRWMLGQESVMCMYIDVTP